MANTTTANTTAENARLTDELSGMDWPDKCSDYHPSSGREFYNLVNAEVAATKAHNRFFERSGKGAKARGHALILYHMATAANDCKERPTVIDCLSIREAVAKARAIGYEMRDVLPADWKRRAIENLEAAQ